MCEVRIGLFARTLLLRVRSLRGLVPVFFGVVLSMGARAAPLCEPQALALAEGRGQWHFAAHAPGATTYFLRWAGDDGMRCHFPVASDWAGRITAVAVAASEHGAVVALATKQPNAIHFVSGSGQVLHSVPVRDRGGRGGSAVCALRVMPQRQSFVAFFPEMTEVWELSYRPTAPEIGTGMVHDFQYREGQFIAGYLNPLRSTVPFGTARFALDDSGHAVVVYPPSTVNSPPALVHLDVRKPIAEPFSATRGVQECSVK